jgi:DHA3 family macrolide efflux protein-like MFS transporter
MPLWIPLVLARSEGNELVLGAVQSALGIGGLVGGLAMSAWGGPKRRIHGVLLGWALSMLPLIPFGLGRTAAAWSAAAFALAFFGPIVNGSNQAIWQAKVAPDVQGRVFAVRALIAQITIPVGMLLAGPLADHVFEPAMAPGGGLADTFGRLVGAGPGAGMGLMIVISGFLGTLVTAGAYALPILRNVEDSLPDHDMATDSPVQLEAS